MELDFPISIENWLNLSTTAHVTHVVVANYDSFFNQKLRQSSYKLRQLLQITTEYQQSDDTNLFPASLSFLSFKFLLFLEKRT